IIMVIPTMGGTMANRAFAFSLPPTSDNQAMAPPLVTAVHSAFGSTRVDPLDLLTRDLVYDPFRAKIYASLPSAAGDVGNSVATIDPRSATVEKTIFIGSEPGKLALSDDGRYL